MDIQAKILVQVIILLTGACAAAWALLAGPLRIAPKACWRYAAANGLLMLGLMLNTLRDDSPSYIAWFAADLCMLSGLVLLRLGTVFLFRQPVSYRLDLLVWGVSGLAMLLVSPELSSQHYLGMVFSVAAAILFARLAIATYQGLLPSAGPRLSALLVTPMLVASLSFALRLVLIITVEHSEEQFISIQTTKAVPVLWFYLVLTIAINALAIGNALTRLVQKIRLLADKDMLTGLWNRRSAEDSLSQLHHKWLRNGEGYAVVLLDLDHFKQINDKFGHHAGDAALRQASLVMTNALRESDVLCRFGGEEFLVILPGASLKQAHQVAEKLRGSLSARAMRWEEKDVPLSASFGCAAILPGMNVSQLISAADHAMYQAKAAGRNRVMDSIMGASAS